MAVAVNDQASGCPRGCPDGECYCVDDSGKFQPCGCLERERCSGCGNCHNCDGCYCGED